MGPTEKESRWDTVGRLEVLPGADSGLLPDGSWLADPTVLYPTITFAGVLYVRSAVPVYLQWLQAISIVNHCFYALLASQADALAPEVGEATCHGCPSRLSLVTSLPISLLTLMRVARRGPLP
jgi:hypothetical protein